MSTDAAAETVMELTLHRRVAANVRAEMARNAMTQADVASLLGIAQQAVSARVRGITPFSLNEVDVLARRFGMTAPELLGGAPSGNHPGPGPGPALPSMRSPRRPGADGDVVRHQGLEPRTRWFGVDEHEPAAAVLPFPRRELAPAALTEAA